MLPASSNLNISIHRRSNVVAPSKLDGCVIVWALLAILLAIAGCKYNDKIEKRSIEDLYGEAVRAANHRPPVVRPTDGGSCGGGCMVAQSNSCAVVAPPNDLSTPAPAQLAAVQSNQAVIAASNTMIQQGPYVSAQSSANDIMLASSQVQLADPIAGTVIPNAISSATFRQTQEAADASSDDRGPRVTDSFEQTDVHEAIQILASSCQASVVIDESVGGVTSAKIENEPFEDALDKILLPLGLVYAHQDGKYIIAPPNPDSPLYSYISKRSQFSPIHHEVQTLAGMLPPRFKPFYQVSVDRNVILVDAPKRLEQDLMQRLRELDQPIPQIELEAIVCVVAPDSSFRFGLDWGKSVEQNSEQTLKVGMSGLATTANISGAGWKNAFSDFAVTSAFVRLLAQEGYITIRAAPRVTSKDGEKATISINRETFFSLQPSNSNVFFRQDVQKVEAGISLEIIPRVHGELVSVQITKAEVSEDIRTSGTNPELTSNPYPIINRRIVTTDVMVRNGHTIVIGGLVQRQTVDRVARIPVLSRIPLAGKLFQTIEKQEQEAEVAIFISPRIVPPEPTCFDVITP